MFDTICHEHLEYYSTKIIFDMCRKNKLKIVDINKNNINGSSKQFFKSAEFNYQPKIEKIKKILKEEEN